MKQIANQKFVFFQIKKKAVHFHSTTSLFEPLNFLKTCLYLKKNLKTTTLKANNGKEDFDSRHKFAIYRLHHTLNAFSKIH